MRLNWPWYIGTYLKLYHIIPYRRNLKLKNLIGASIKQNRNGSWTFIVTYCVYHV